MPKEFAAPLHTPGQLHAYGGLGETEAPGDFPGVQAAQDPQHDNLPAAIRQIDHRGGDEFKFILATDAFDHISIVFQNAQRSQFVYRYRRNKFLFAEKTNDRIARDVKEKSFYRSQPARPGGRDTP